MLEMNDDKLFLTFTRQKNRPTGSKLELWAPSDSLAGLEAHFDEGGVPDELLELLPKPNAAAAVNIKPEAGV